jgi:hypothetical protein
MRRGRFDRGSAFTAAGLVLGALAPWLPGAEGHWAYAPPQRPALPEVQARGWPRQASDRFILARLEAEELAPAPEADRQTLARRLHLDLLGLPPSPEDVERFQADRSPDAVERLIDRLLAAPQLGERLAVFWLDLVRYADTVGYHGDQEHASSPYRDYVIVALNAGLPFDRFTLEQLAGDLLPDPTLDQRIATGYHRILQTTHEGGAQDGEYRAKYSADRVRNLGAVWLGSTLGCAECHDHKFDPLPQRDFYRFAAFFADIEEQGAFRAPDESPTRRAPEIEVLDPTARQEIAQIDARLAALGAERAGAARGAGAAPPPDIDAEIEALEKRRAALAKAKRRAMVTATAKPRPIRVLRRGDWLDSSGEIVEPGVPAALPALGVEGRRATRLDLARWLCRPEHPLTARVLANRLWAIFFGRALVRSLDDFGSQGEKPSHPDLLDWLALDLSGRGWDLKRWIGRLASSSAYRQSSAADASLAVRDPENRLFARQGRFRVPAETVRDIALAASGLLVERLGGPSARPYQPAGYYAHLNFPKREYAADSGESQFRRGVYVHWQRQYLHPMLKAFDAPSREECVARRPESNTPQAALVLLNDPSLVEAARRLAARALSEGGPERSGRLDRAFRLVLARAPRPEEMAVLDRLLDAELAVYAADPEAARRLLGIGISGAPARLDPVELAAWTAAARALLNLSETITRT